MNTDIFNTPLTELKQQAKRLRAALAAAGTPVGHSRSLELLAQQLGYKDWNVLHAAAGNRPARPSLAVGQRVSGRYLGQDFSGELIGVQHHPDTGRCRITVQFDEPVDVVTFDSFSSYRRRVSCFVGKDGRTVEKTSDGVPHMCLDR